MLATGGRISKIHALYREEPFITDPMLTAQCPLRQTLPSWQITKIPLVEELLLPYGRPINTLKKYLEKTSQNRVGPLFLNHRSLRPCSMVKVQCIFKDLIVRTNPQARARFHNIMKFTFLSRMSTKELCVRIGWSSIRIIKKTLPEAAWSSPAHVHLPGL